jgi:uncharacterized Zn-binding protein involved in type VI secretion
MPKVIRLGDLSAGLDGAPTPCITASVNVFTNSVGTHRKTDSWAPHGIPIHGRTTIVGSSTVFVNGKAIARTGDAISCGDVCGNGSSNVYAGG